jgi:uncharacterized membrane protein
MSVASTSQEVLRLTRTIETPILGLVTVMPLLRPVYWILNSLLTVIFIFTQYKGATRHHQKEQDCPALARRSWGLTFVYRQ